jgi:hypothetical protein
VFDNVVWTDSWPSIAGAGYGLIHVGAGEQQASKVLALQGLRGVETLLDFPLNATHKMCCNMPYLVAIDTIATKLFRRPWDAKGRVTLGYCDVVHQVVAKVFLLQRNATLQLGFLLRLFWLQSVLLRRIWGVAKGAIATFLFRCKL